MPVKSPAATPTKTRKTRTRKTSPTRTRKVAKTAKVIKEVQAVLDAPRETKPAKAKKPVSPRVTVTTFKGGKVVAKKTTLKRPSTARLISTDRYIKDIQTRWQIHNFEIQELISDIMKGFEAVKPYHAQLVKMVNK